MNKWEWYWFHIKRGLNYGFSFLGVVWLVIQLSVFFSKSLEADFIKPYWWVFLILSILVALKHGWPIKTTTQRTPQIDIVIEIAVRDIFKLSGSIIIPTSTTFDTSVEEGIVNIHSVQGQYIENYYKNDVQKLDREIENALKKEPYKQLEKNQKPKGKLKLYKMGTVAPISDAKNMNYLFAMANVNEYGNVSTTIENIMDALPQLWESIKEKGDHGQILIPVIGTKYGRIKADHEKVIQEVIKSFLAACSSFGRFCEKLTIVIYPKDFKGGAIDFYRLSQFLEYTCKYGSNVLSVNNEHAVGDSAV